MRIFCGVVFVVSSIFCGCVLVLLTGYGLQILSAATQGPVQLVWYTRELIGAGIGIGCTAWIFTLLGLSTNLD